MTCRVASLVACLLIGAAASAHAQLTFGSVGGALAPPGTPSNLSSGPLAAPAPAAPLPAPGGIAQAAPWPGQQSTVGPPSALPPVSTGPQPTGLVQLPYPVVVDPYQIAAILGGRLPADSAKTPTQGGAPPAGLSPK